MTEKIAIIVLCYNGIHHTLKCLESLYGQDLSNFEIIVVDNGSLDHTPLLVRQKYPQAIVIENQKNLGYAEGNNIGIRLAMQREADFVFLVNNDTLVSRTCTSRLVEAIKTTPAAGAAGPMIYSDREQKIIGSAGGAVLWNKASAINVGMGERDNGQYKRRPVEFVNGCGILVSKDAIDKAGMLDPDYFMYWEETDWCMRIKKKGYNIIFEPASKMVHLASINPMELGPTTLYYVTRNRFLFFGRYASGVKKPIALMKALHGALKGLINDTNSGRKPQAKAMQFAIYHAIKGQWGYTNPLDFSV